MKSLDKVLAVGTILPTLLVASAGLAAAATSDEAGTTSAPVVTQRFAQAATPDELRPETEKKKKDAAGAAHPANGAAKPATGAAKPAEAGSPVPPKKAPPAVRDPKREPAAGAPAATGAAPGTAPGAAPGKPVPPKKHAEPPKPVPPRPGAPGVGAPSAPAAPLAPAAPAIKPPSAPIGAAPTRPPEPGKPEPGKIEKPERPVAPPATGVPAVQPPAAPPAGSGAPPAVTPPPAAPLPVAPQPAPTQVEPPRPQGAAPVPQGGDGRPVPPPPRADNGPGTGAVLGAAAAGVAVGVIGGMMLGGEAHALDDVHRQRRETVQGGVTYYAEPGRVIVRDDQGLHLRHDETERFRAFGGTIREETRGDEVVRVWDRPDGVRIVTVTDRDGNLLRRVRRWPSGREEVLIDDGFRPRPRSYREEVVVLPPPPVPVERRIVDAERADEKIVYDTLDAAPFAPLPRRYTLAEVRASRDVRAYVGAVDIDTITFDTGSWTIEPDQVGRLDVIARSVAKILSRNPNEVFLVEGHTDAVGSDVDNLSLSDRRAQSVAAVLTRDFRIPAENLVTQGYGETELKEQTTGPSRINRRVTIRRITPLIASGH